MQTRRYDLDWLRIIVFGLLIFYHVGMFFVPWEWHIANNVEYEWLTWPMRALNRWRLPILFMISGMGTYYAFSKRSATQYRKERLLRLGIPLLVGMLLVVPPQIYIERLVNGQFTGSYGEFYLTQAFRGGTYPTGNLSWHHLWFLPYLLVYALVLAPVFAYLKQHPEAPFLQWVKRLIQPKFGLNYFALPLLGVGASLAPFFPVTHALVGDWYTLLRYLILFFYGFLFVALGDDLWQAVDRLKRPALYISLVSFAAEMLIIIYGGKGTSAYIGAGILQLIFRWSVIIAIIGYAAKYLNKRSSAHHYLNEAVYPFYIFHQTITIILGYWVMGWEASFIVKFVLMSLGTLLGSWILFEITRRINIVRPLFGMKGTFNSHAQSHPPTSPHTATPKS